MKKKIISAKKINSKMFISLAKKEAKKELYVEFPTPKETKELEKFLQDNIKHLDIGKLIKKLQEMKLTEFSIGYVLGQIIYRNTVRQMALQNLVKEKFDNQDGFGGAG